MDLKTAVVILVLSVPFFAGTVWAIVNAARKEFSSVGEKALWVVIAAIPFIGFIIYLLLGFKKGVIPSQSR